VSKWFSFIGNFIFRNSQKLQGAKCGEYGVWGHGYLFLSVKN
jgi:hypothetical protein